MRTLMLTLVLLVITGIVQMWPSPSQQWVGLIADIEPGQWIRVASDQTDPGGFEIALSDRTRIDGDPGALRRNTRVRVFFTHSGGPPVARRISILPDAPQRPLRKPQKDLRQ